MKVASVHIENFKRFGELDIPIRNSITEDVAEQFLILGDNGTGKTTVLQAVALCLSVASHRIRSVEEFDWTGWLAGRYLRWGTPIVELEVHFTPDEVAATRETSERWWEWRRQKVADPGHYVAPGDALALTVRLEGEKPTVPGAGRAGLLQLGGRACAAAMLKDDPSARDLFDRLPGFFWFDQFRNLASPPPDYGGNGEDGLQPGVSFQVGVARLREHLNGWLLARLGGRYPTRDWLLELENQYKRVFPGRSFSTPEPMYRGGVPTPSDYYFMLADSHRTYEIEEMSAGEQSVFPLLYEFVRQQIRNSVVLIDEVDLNLHPPLAQAVLSSLPSMGPGCQFLMTTHSEAISSVVSPAQVHRLAGGKLCL